ncbi:MAG: PEGA domain-containing protein [Acidobacteriales bacterium]|nr:PEGA domain-containing protein [Terriglobales bacterium]
MTTRVLFLCLLGLAMAAPAHAADSGWQPGRVVSVDKDVNTKTLYTIVNTPVTQDEITYRIAVHAGRTLLTGSYEPGKAQGEPPKEWVADFPVSVQVDGTEMYLRSSAGDQYKLHVDRRKPAPAMRPWSKQELAQTVPAPVPVENRPIGIGSAPPAPESRPVAAAPAEPEPAPSPKPAPPSGEPPGLVTVRTTPYLAEVYVDGNDMGYTPAKLNLSPGKHSVRLEKHGYKKWSKEFTVTSGSEQLIDATLEGADTGK